MKDLLENRIEQLSFRVRLFMESSGRGGHADQLSERELVFLEYLEKKGAVSFSQLSAFFKQISASTVSNTLKKLYQQGLITRDDDPRDLRAKIFAISAAGRKFLGPVKRDQAEVFKAITEYLSLSPREHEMMSDVIQRAIRNFDKWLGFNGNTETDGGGDRAAAYKKVG